MAKKCNVERITTTFGRGRKITEFRCKNLKRKPTKKEIYNAKMGLKTIDRFMEESE